MPAVQLVPDKTRLRAFLRQGLSQREIAEAWEQESGNKVSRSAIAMAIERYGLKSAHERKRYDDLIPWQVKKEHAWALDARMLRLEARRRRGEKLGEKQQRWLDKWKADLAGLGCVVAYLGDTEKGFWWIPREKMHGDSLIELPEQTQAAQAKVRNRA